MEKYRMKKEFHSTLKLSPEIKKKTINDNIISRNKVFRKLKENKLRIEKNEEENEEEEENKLIEKLKRNKKLSLERNSKSAEKAKEEQYRIDRILSSNTNYRIAYPFQFKKQYEELLSNRKKSSLSPIKYLK